MADEPKRQRRKASEVDNELIKCLHCGNEFKAKDLYVTNSVFYEGVRKLPYCKKCISELYKHYYEKFKALDYKAPNKKAVERLCMTFNIYYSDAIFNAAARELENNEIWETTVMALYMKHVSMSQYRNKDYDSTVYLKYSEEKDKEVTIAFYNDEEEYISETVKNSMKIFGSGFEDEDYIFLWEQYCDWTARNECNTKAQEEVFKNICLTQLQLNKAVRAREDTDKISSQLQKWLDTGKLQPKQNSGDTVSDTQSFGTLINKWETTRPIPEADPELADVDYLGKYIDVFFKGGLADSLGLNIEFSQDYREWMKELTVEKPEYDDDIEDNGVAKEIHEAVFGVSIEDTIDGE